MTGFLILGATDGFYMIGKMMQTCNSLEKETVIMDRILWGQEC